jgi:hypothetical protein
MKKFGEEEVGQLTTGWNEAYAVRGAAGFAGALIVALTVRSLWEKRCGPFAALLRFCVGIPLLVFAVWPQGAVDLFVRIPHEYRVRFLVGGLSLLVIIITLESIRRTHLQERYALLWLVTGGIILVSVFFPQVFVFLRTVAGMRYNQALIAVAFTFLVLVAFHFSISISSSRSNQARIAQRVAILEERIRSMEKGGGSGKGAAGGDAGAGAGGEEGSPQDAG